MQESSKVDAPLSPTSPSSSHLNLDFGSKAETNIPASQIFGSLNSDIILDEFSFEQVQGIKCEAQLARKVCGSLLSKITGSNLRDPEYLTICVPCYNEHFDELESTISSLMANIEFLKTRTRFYEDAEGLKLKRKFMKLKPVIVPIFDGMKAIHPTMKAWLDVNFNGITKGIEDGKSKEGKVDVRVGLGSWWYGCEDYTEEPDTQGDQMPSGVEMSEAGGARGTRVTSRSSWTSRESLSIEMTTVLDFYVLPIVKRSNHRKHNSHQWFFNSVCEGLKTHCSLAFLTDCGTTYQTTCLARLIYDMHFRPDIM